MLCLKSPKIILIYFVNMILIQIIQLLRFIRLFNDCMENNYVLWKVYSPYQSTIDKGNIYLFTIIFRFESQRIHPHLLHHRQQTIATGRRKMFFQSYLINKIKIGI